MDKRLEEFQLLLNQTSARGAGAAVDLLLGQMHTDQARCLRLCAIPHEFDVSILRALAPELSEEQAREYCEAFSKLSLVAKHGESLAIHEESRRYLFDQWLEAERETEFRDASARLSEYFAALSERLKTETTTERSDAVEQVLRKRMFHLVGASRAEGLAEFERLCRQRRQEMRFGQCETLIRLIHEYDRALNSFEKAVVAYHEGKLAADRRQWHTAEELYTRVLDTPGVPAQMQVKTLCRLGIVEDDRRRWDAAIDRFQKALEVADARPDCRQQIVHLHVNLGSAYRDSNRLPDAEKFLKKGIALAQESQDLSSAADGYNAFGTLYLKLNDIGSAIEAFETSLKYLQQLGDKFRCAQVYNNLGNARFNRQEWAESEELFRQSLEIKREAGDNAGQALTLRNLARVYRAQQRMHDAIAALEQAAVLSGEVRDDYNAAQAKRDLARVHRSMINDDLANRAFDEATALFERCHDIQEAQATRDEARPKKGALPWWVILAIVLFVVLVVLMILALRFHW
jgi:tetratricopeptide (TPR) repeat protein